MANKRIPVELQAHVDTFTQSFIQAHMSRQAKDYKMTTEDANTIVDNALAVAEAVVSRQEPEKDN